MFKKLDADLEDWLAMWTEVQDYKRARLAPHTHSPPISFVDAAQAGQSENMRCCIGELEKYIAEQEDVLKAEEAARAPAAAAAAETEQA